MTPIALTDDELDAVYRAARPLPVHQRDAFLQRVADELANCPELGPGVVARACRITQREFFDPPDLGQGAGWSKYG
jgi:hypothetical protein